MRLPFNFIRTHPRSKRTTTNTREPEHEETFRPDTDMTVIENTNEHSAHIISKDARVYLHYDVENPPPSPGDDWTRFICLSDTHSNIYPVPDGDVLLHSGDLSSWGHLSQLKRTMTWLTSLPHPVKIIIAGNHDLCLDDEWRAGGTWDHQTGGAISNKDVDAAQELMCSDASRAAGLHYLNHEGLQFTTSNGRTWDVYGSPACPRYAIGAFQYVGGFGSKEGDEIYARIPRSTEILLTHTPPYGICNLSKRGKHAGCPSLASRLDSEDLANCRLHVFGHIHEAYGATLSGPEGLRNSRVSVNAALHNDEIPVIVDLLN